MVTQNDHVTFTSPSAGARRPQAVAAVSHQNQESADTPFAAWTSEHDQALNQRAGEELLGAMDWDLFAANAAVAIDTPVSNGYILPAFRGHYAMLD